MKILAFILIFTVSIFAYADNNFANAFDEGLRTGGNNLGQPQQQAQAHLSNPAKTFDQYNPNPSQSQYYGGERQSSTILSQDAAANVAKDPVGAAVLGSFTQRPEIKVTNNSPEIQRPKLITDHATNIVEGISDQFVDCKKTQSCTTTYLQSTCTEPAKKNTQVCTKDLQVHVTPDKPFTLDVGVQAHGMTFGKKTIQWVVDLRTGRIVSVSDDIAGPDVELSAPVVAFPCDNLQVSVIDSWNVGITSMPHCGNQQHISFYTEHTSCIAGFCGNGGKFTLRFTATVKGEYSEKWEGCSNLEELVKQNICAATSDLCTSGRATKIINGISVTKDCWQKKLIYQCGKGGTDTCQPFRDQGCEQIGSACKEQAGAMCFSYDQTFRCPVKKCTGGVGIVCGGDTFCLKGDCAKKDRIPDHDFEKSVSTLSAMADAAKQFDHNFIFKGQGKKCAKTIVGFSDCCADKGWGQDIGLDKCSDDEKKLGKDKETGLAIYVGDYCANKVLGQCLLTKKSYCVFPSKLARIIQQQGRREQLGIGFGTGEDPYCRGLTPEELQRIDFSKIDFGEFYQDLKNKTVMPNLNQVESKLSDRINQMYQQQQPRT